MTIQEHYTTMGIKITRKGRTRKAGVRMRNGNLRPDTDIRAVVLAQPHRRGLKIVQDAQGRVISDHRLDAKAESPLGRLRLAEGISEAEYDAGVRYATIVRRYRAVIASWDPTMRPVAGSGNEITTDEAKRRKSAYDGAFIALGEAGQIAQRLVARIAVYHEPPQTHEVMHIKRGLGVLAVFFRLTATGKSRPCGNASSITAPADKLSEAL